MRKNIPYIIGGITTLALVGMLLYNIYHTPYSDDIQNYFRYATSVMRGKIPFKDFTIEYPPFSLLFMIIPALFSKDIFQYKIWFGVFSLLWLLVPVIVFYVKQKNIWKGLIYTLMLLLFPAEITFQRLDIIMAILIFISLHFYTNQQHTLSTITLGLATSLKFIPVILFPLYLILYPTGKDRILQSIWFVATIVLSILPFLFMGADMGQLFYFWTYNQNREIQLESIWSSVGMLFYQPVSVYTAYGAKNISFSLSHVYSLLALYITGAVLCFTYILSWFKRKTNRPLFLSVFIILLITIAFNKVFSPQYLLWLIPLVPECIAGFTRKYKIILVGMISAILVLTHLIVPIYYMDLIHLIPFAVILLIIRNSLLLGLLCYTIILFVQYDQKSIHRTANI